VSVWLLKRKVGKHLVGRLCCLQPTGHRGGCSPANKRPKLETGPSFACNALVKSVWSYTSCPACFFTPLFFVKQRDKLNFFISELTCATTLETDGMSLPVGTLLKRNLTLKIRTDVLCLHFASHTHTKNYKTSWMKLLELKHVRCDIVH
jgi:hypothetical protein